MSGSVIYKRKYLLLSGPFHTLQHQFFSHHSKSGIFVVGVEVPKATVETDMLGNDFH